MNTPPRGPAAPGRWERQQDETDLRRLIATIEALEPADPGKAAIRRHLLTKLSAYTGNRGRPIDQ